MGSRVLKVEPKAERPKSPLGRGQTGWVPSGQALRTKVGPGDSQRRSKARNTRRRVDRRRRRPGSPAGLEAVLNGRLRGAGSSGCFSARASEWRWRAEGGSATEASNGGVGALRQ